MSRAKKEAERKARRDAHTSGTEPEIVQFLRGYHLSRRLYSFLLGAK